jgi:DNA-binding transcriptional MerR regulator
VTGLEVFGNGANSKLGNPLHSPVTGRSTVNMGTIMDEALTITSLAKRTGISTKTLRYWEGLGLLPETSRTHNGYRLFSAAMIRYVQFIMESKGLGLTLKEIRSAIELFRKGGNPCPTVAQRLQVRSSALEKQIQALRKLKERMERLGRKWSKDPGNFCFWEIELCRTACGCPDSVHRKGDRNEKIVHGRSGAVRSSSRQGSDNGRRRVLPSVLSGDVSEKCEAADLRPQHLLQGEEGQS